MLAQVGQRRRIAGVDRRGGAELARQRQLVCAQIDRDDLAGADQQAAQQGVQADAAEADHGDGRAGGDAGGVHHRADAGQDRAAEQRRLLDTESEGSNLISERRETTAYSANADTPR